MHLVHYATKMSRKAKMKKLLILPILLFACTPKQEPVQTIINYTDNSQTIQVAGDGNQLAATTDIETAQTAKPEQTTENVKEDNMWIVWVLVLVAIVGAIYWYQKKRIL